MSQVVEALPPDWTVRVRNAKLAAGRILGRVIHGGRLGVPLAEVDRRLAACARCAEFRASDQVCAQCGCFISLKARLATEVCPLGNWTVQEPPQPKILTGNQLFERELELRAILPPDHPLAQTFNQFHSGNHEGGCPDCRKRAYGRTLAAVLVDFLVAHATVEEVNRTRALFPGTTHIEAGRVAKAWASFNRTQPEGAEHG